MVAIVVCINCLLSCTMKVTERNDYQQVMKVHDDAMARMGEIYEVKRTIEDLSNSIEDSIQLVEAKEIITSLEMADEGMMQWMAAFRIPDDVSNASLESYFFEEQKKVNIVSNSINEAIDKANKFVKEIKSYQE